MAFIGDNATAPTLTVSVDSAGNTWAYTSATFTSATLNGRWGYVCDAIAGSDTITVNTTVTTGVVVGLVFWEVSGLAQSNCFDQHHEATANSTTAFNSGATGTLAQPNEYAASVCWNQFNTYTFTATGAWTKQNSPATGVKTGCVLDQNVSSTAAVTGTATASAATSSAGMMLVATFRLAGLDEDFWQQGPLPWLGNLTTVFSSLFIPLFAHMLQYVFFFVAMAAMLSVFAANWTALKSLIASAMAACRKVRVRRRVSVEDGLRKERAKREVRELERIIRK